LQHVRSSGLVPSPVKDNIIDASVFAETVARLSLANRRASVRGSDLPDNSMLAVIDFETLPDKEENALR